MTAALEPPMRLVTTQIALSALADIAEGQFGELVKAVVDITRGIMVIGGELHADEEGYLLDIGSAQADLWGINLYPAAHPDSDWLEYDSMINLRPRQGNRSRSVEDAAARQRIAAIVAELLEADG